MKTQYGLVVKHNAFKDRWFNGASYVKRLDGSDSSRYFDTKEDAENALKVVFKKFNFNDGDDELKIIDWKISKRVVSDWEVVEGLSLPVERRKS